MKFRLVDQPVAYTEALKSILAAAVVFGWVHLSGVQVAGFERAVTAVFSLFIWSQVTPNAHVAAKVDEAQAAGVEQGAAAKETEIHTYLAAVQDAAAVKPSERSKTKSKRTPTASSLAAKAGNTASPGD